MLCQYRHCRKILRKSPRPKSRPLKYCDKNCSVKEYGLNVRGTGKSHIVIRVNGKRVYLHRHIKEQEIGRPLLPDEIVHHRDEDKFRNVGDNLEITTRSQHIRSHKWWIARCVPKDYDPEHDYDADRERFALQGKGKIDTSFNPADYEDDPLIPF